jgi:hypothetical protein
MLAEITMQKYNGLEIHRALTYSRLFANIVGEKLKKNATTIFLGEEH